MLSRLLVPVQPWVLVLPLMLGPPPVLMLPDLLGVRKYNYGIAEEENKIGQVTGLAWTSVGGGPGGS